MADILIARGGFRDDTALLRLAHAADLTTRTVEAGLVGLRHDELRPLRRDAPVCVIFAARTHLGVPEDPLTEALRHLSGEYRELAFLGVLDEVVEPGGCRARRAHATAMLLEAGADEVVRFDLDPAELAARVRVAVRRVKAAAHRAGLAPAPDGLEQSPRVDLRHREIVGARGRVPLTAKEAAVMAVLAESDGVVDRDQLGAVLWTGTWQGSPKAIDMHIASLRRKLPQACGDDWRIATVRGAGFVLDELRGA